MLAVCMSSAVFFPLNCVSILLCVISGGVPTSPTSPSYGLSATTDRLFSAIDSGLDSSLLGNGLSARQSQTLPRRCMTPSWDSGSKMMSSPMNNKVLPLVSHMYRSLFEVVYCSVIR